MNTVIPVEFMIYPTDPETRRIAGEEHEGFLKLSQLMRLDEVKLLHRDGTIVLPKDFRTTLKCEAVLIRTITLQLGNDNGFVVVSAFVEGSQTTAPFGMLS